MSHRTSIEISARARAACSRARAIAAPREACGVLVGDASRIAEAWALANLSADAGRFVLDPGAIVASHERALALGLELVGFWHTHADSPARPSRADLSATWPGCALVIAGTDGARGWTRADGGWRELALVEGGGV